MSTDPDSSNYGGPSYCAACGHKVVGDEAACPQCGGPLQVSKSAPPLRGPDWLTDIFAMIIAQIATLVASIFIRFSTMVEMFYFCIFILAILLHRRWRSLNRKQLIIRSLLLLVVGAAIFALFLGGLYVGCSYLLRNVH
jgi:predicted amidophosphoribosyltransferase